MFIAKEGWPFIIIPLVLGISFLVFGRGFAVGGLGAAAVVFGLFCAFFFRDPPRKIPAGENLVLAPCDGTVIEITEEEGMKVVRMFLSIFNVHLQRAPVSGIVTDVRYKPGKFVPAMQPQAHDVNEQNVITLRSKNGDFRVKQIAGILARRIVSWVKPQEAIERGNKLGLIKFGSQVDLYVPKNVAIKVALGEKVVGGETIVGEVR